MSSAPSAAKGTLGAETISKKNKEADEEIERMLAQLKSWKGKRKSSTVPVMKYLIQVEINCVMLLVLTHRT